MYVDVFSIRIDRPALECKPFQCLKLEEVFKLRKEKENKEVARRRKRKRAKDKKRTKKQDIKKKRRRQD